MGEMLELNFKLIAQLHRLGITEITLTAKAADKLAAQSKGLYKGDMLPLPPDVFGIIFGICFYREPEESHGQAA